MRSILLGLISFLIWHPVLAQDTPQHLHIFTQDWPIAGARWNPANHDFWTWNRSFAHQTNGSADYQDWLFSWNGDNGRLNTQIQYHGDNVAMNLDWSAGENRVLVYSGTSLKIWDAITGSKTWTKDYSARISGAHWSADFTRILFWSYDDGSIHIWDTHTNQQTFLAETNLPSDLVEAEWSPDEKSVLGVITQAPGRVDIWDVASGTKTRTFDYTNMVYRASWNADGTHILIEADHNIQLVDVATQTVIFEKHDAPYLYKVQWSSDRKLVTVRVETEPLVEIWDTTSGQVVSKLIQSGYIDNIIYEVQWSKDNQRLLTHSPGGISLWDTITGANLFQLPTNVSPLNLSWLSWSPDETKLVYLLSNTEPKIMTLSDQTSLDLKLPAPIALSLPAAKFVWNADNTQVMLSGVDGTARIWDTTSGKLLASLQHPAHEGFQSQWVTDAQWSPDQQLILTLGTPDYCGGVDTCPSEAMLWQAP